MVSLAHFLSPGSIPCAWVGSGPVPRLRRSRSLVPRGVVIHGVHEAFSTGIGSDNFLRQFSLGNSPEHPGIQVVDGEIILGRRWNAERWPFVLLFVLWLLLIPVAEFLFQLANQLGC